MEEKNRANYNTLMLWMIAQPTRKHPENLEKYKPIYDDIIKIKRGKEMTGEEILAELIGNNK